MARPRKTDVPDLANRLSLTAGGIERLACPDGKQQAFMRDSEVPGLRVRVTAAGAKSFVYEAKLNRQTIRRTIGDVRTWSIEQARTEARRLAVLLDGGQDPRELDREQMAAQAEAAAKVKADAVTVGDLWPTYLIEGHPKKAKAFKPRYLSDLHRMAAPGGEKPKGGLKVPKDGPKPLTRQGPLFPLLALPLATIDEDELQAWFDREARISRHQAARALMMFRGFLRWAKGKKEIRAVVNRDAAKAPALLDAMPAKENRTDALDTAQVPGWWAGVEQVPNVTASAYLRALLLSGARREEMAALKWADIDFSWNRLTLADKVGDTRTIPLCDYMAWLLDSLPRKGEYVFSSASKTGRMVDARKSHEKALKLAGIGHLTFHGLRRSFALLGESAGAPEGAIAQVMGHRPSATHSGYKPRTVDQLRPYFAQVEAHILKLAGVEFIPVRKAGRLQLIA